MSKTTDEDDGSFIDKVGVSTGRKLRARREKRESIWFGLGLFGIVGWAVVIPTLIGLAIGIWVDKKFDDQVSWTITFLLIGVGVGCLNAWYWVTQQRKRIEQRKNG